MRATCCDVAFRTKARQEHAKKKDVVIGTRHCRLWRQRDERLEGLPSIVSADCSGGSPLDAVEEAKGSCHHVQTTD